MSAEISALDLMGYNQILPNIEFMACLYESGLPESEIDFEKISKISQLVNALEGEARDTFFQTLNQNFVTLNPDSGLKILGDTNGVP
jgi:hypothetical protein